MNLNNKFNLWKTQNNQHGRQAFSRFIMLSFLDALQDTSEDFVFKGGNLLWHYIKTPRETVDLDLATLNIKSHTEVRDLLVTSFAKHKDVVFTLKDFKELDGDNEVGASVIIAFATTSAQKNQFSIDIVYALPTDIKKIKSTLDGQRRQAASIENIICDKLLASHQFKSGNTRMKDFDDLWRIIKSEVNIDSIVFTRLLIERKVSHQLNTDWIPFLEDSWKRHTKSYKDIPKGLEDVFKDINKGLESIVNK